MNSRLPDAPPLKRLPTEIQAATYNRTLRLFARYGAPQELVLGARGLHFRLARDLWLCSDRRLDGVPLLAWCAFERGRRGGLHVPVGCQVLYYHPWGGVIEPAALHDLDRRLAARLAEAMPPLRGARVVTLDRGEYR